MCLLAVEGRETIRVYDRLPLEVREAIRNSPFNICPSCIIHMAYQLGSSLRPTTKNYMKALRMMEDAIRNTTNGGK